MAISGGAAECPEGANGRSYFCSRWQLGTLPVPAHDVRKAIERKAFILRCFVICRHGIVIFHQYTRWAERTRRVNRIA